MPAVMSMYVPPLPSTNILDLDYGTFRTICQHLDVDLRWRRLVELADGNRVFQLNAHQVEGIARVIHSSLNASPATELLKKWSSLGMTVGVLTQLLQKMQEEVCLLYLKSKEPIRIIAQPPQHMELMEGQVLEISCEATGFPSPHFVWFRGQTRISDKLDGSLKIENISMEHAGTYTCRLHQEYHGELTHAFTNRCHIVVKPSPFPKSLPNPDGQLYITVHPESVSVRHGQSFTLKCVAGGTQPITYVWVKDGNLVPQCNGSSITFPQASEVNLGAYYCIVNNGLQEMRSNTARVTLLGNGIQSSGNSGYPVIVSQPTATQTHREHGRALFSIKVSSQSPYTIQWFHNGYPLPGENKSDLIVDVKGRESAGKYQAHVIAEGCQPILSHESRLVYDPSPQNSYYAHDKVALVIGTATYRSYGPPLPAVQFDLVETEKLLSEMGFHVVSLIDLTLLEMKDAVQHFCDLVAEGVYVIFYCAGHGYQDSAHRHYLMPWDTQEGIRDNECLCIDDVEAQIQQKSPALLLLFLDICRKNVTQFSPPTVVRTASIGPSRPNRAIFYASSSGQESYEEKDGRTTERVPRGIFNRYFVESMKQRGLKVGEMFARLQKKFQNCPYDRTKFPQNPELTTNIRELDRSLWDPVDPDKRLLLKNSRMHDWESFRVVPSSQYISVQGVADIELSFARSIGNTLFVLTRINAAPKFRVNVSIVEEELDPIVKPIRKLRRQFNGIDGYQLSNIQRLQNHLRLPLQVRFVFADQPDMIQTIQRYTLDLGLPLIARLCLGSGASPPPPPRVQGQGAEAQRQVVEHSGIACSLSGLAGEKTLQ